MLTKIKQVIQTVKAMLALEKKTITMRGQTSTKYLYKYFTRPHPRYKVIPNKAFGVALIELPSHFEKFLDGSSMRDMRNKRNRALRDGYEFRGIQSLDYQDDILEVNRSAEVRQGHEMPHDYMDSKVVLAYLRENPEFYAVFDRDGHLRAYMHVMLFGEICVICRILGHMEFVKDGIMYLMISELVKKLVGANPEVKYLMYDTVFGAAPGLRYFKDRSGFVPFRVKWIWQTTDNVGNPST